MHKDIEKATTNDFTEILELYRLAITFHKRLGIIQWDDDYPSTETLKENLELGATWVIKLNDKIIATVTLDENQDPQYENIQWVYPSSNVLVVHRVCINPSFQGQGLAKSLMFFSENYARENKYEVIRFDAFLGNDASQRLYRNLGYHEAIGYCYYHPDQIMCNCFEKRVF
jgi:ribosomal protein S18 acetylase RimI-like enzyme